MTPRERVVSGYLTWSENFIYVFSYFPINKTSRLDKRINFHYRIDIFIKGFLRSLFCPLDFDKLSAKLKDDIITISQLNPDKYYLAKKSGKIKL